MLSLATWSLTHRQFRQLRAHQHTRLRHLATPSTNPGLMTYKKFLTVDTCTASAVQAYLTVVRTEADGPRSVPPDRDVRGSYRYDANIYDDATFFEGYGQLGRSADGLAGAVEWSAIQPCSRTCTASRSWTSAAASVGSAVGHARMVQRTCSGSTSPRKCSHKRRLKLQVPRSATSTLS